MLCDPFIDLFVLCCELVLVAGVNLLTMPKHVGVD